MSAWTVETYVHIKHSVSSVNKLTMVISVLSTRAQLFKRWINLYPVDSAIATPKIKGWIVICPMDSSIQRLNNHGQVSSCKTGKNVMTSSPSKKVIVLYIPYIVDHTQHTYLYIHDWMNLYDEYSHRNIHFFPMAGLCYEGTTLLKFLISQMVSRTVCAEVCWKIWWVAGVT